MPTCNAVDPAFEIRQLKILRKMVQKGENPSDSLN
jgi:hypothetical protein